MTTRNRIDVHHHVFPPQFVRALERAGVKDAGGIPFPAWSVERALEMMDREQIGSAIASLSAPGVWLGDARAARDLARSSNEFLAGLVRDHPTRFGAFASLPLPDTGAAVAEASYALDKLGCDGVMLLASIADRFLGDPQFDELMQELNRRRAVVFVHPHEHSSSHALGLEAPGTLFEFIADTSRAALNLLWTGTFERYPEIRWILAHAGGAVPYLAWRWTLADTVPAFRARAPQGALTYLKRLYFETGLSVSPYAMKPVLDLAGPEHVLFGSDFPYAAGPVLTKELRDLDQLELFDAGTREAMENGNARRLFPRLEAPGR